MGSGKKAGPTQRIIPEGDNRERLVCGDCGYIVYDNPKIVAGSVVEADDGRILLCRRAIEPGRGRWTLPAGYLELGESPEMGALREALEEANAELELTGLLGIYSIIHLSQVQLIYRARFKRPEFSAGPESLEVQLFTWDEIPWDELAFESVGWALEDYRSSLGRPITPVSSRTSTPRTRANVQMAR